MRLYREAGNANAVLANVVVDLSAQVEAGSLAERAKVSFVCLPDDARQRLKRLERIGFDEVLLVSPAGRLDELERVRGFLSQPTQFRFPVGPTSFPLSGVPL